MNTRKINTLGKTLLKELGFDILIASIVAFAIQLLRITSLSSWPAYFHIAFSFWAAIINLVVFVFLLFVPYKTFIQGIQMGTSRKDIWIANWYILIFSFLIAEISGLPALLVNNTPAVLGEFSLDFTFTSFLGDFAVFLTALTIGTGFSLLNRLGKLLVGIGLPIILSYIIYLFASLYFSSGIDLSSSLFTLIKILSTGHLGLFLYLLILAFLQFFFNMRQQQRRD